MRKLKNEELNRDSIEEFRKKPKLPIVVVLDNIRSLSNIGSVFRTSDAMAIEKIILCGITAQPPHREIHKTALGSTQSVEWEYEESTFEAVQKLKKNGHSIICIEQADQSISLPDFFPNKSTKYALVFGNEVNGVDDTVLNYCDACVEIPQWGTKHSLNISVSAGIVLWDMNLKFK